jgi:hypothetical protein
MPCGSFISQIANPTNKATYARNGKGVKIKPLHHFVALGYLLNYFKAFNFSIHI